MKKEIKNSKDLIASYSNNYIAYDSRYLKANYSEPAPTPFDQGFSVSVSIEKDETTGKIHYLEKTSGDVIHRNIDKEFQTVSEAFEHFYITDDIIPFYNFKLIYIFKPRIFSFTKQLIEKLNLDQVNRDMSWDNKYFKKHLGIELYLIKNANEKKLQEINLIKDENTQNEIKSFFVGKLEVQGNMISIKDENDNIIYLTSNQNITVKTEIIHTRYYWYFKK